MTKVDPGLFDGIHGKLNKQFYLRVIANLHFTILDIAILHLTLLLVI